MKQLSAILIGSACAAIAAWSCIAQTVSPLSPQQEQATFQLADTNLIIEVVVAEPAVRAPVALAWDADGRMFVAEMTDYPSGPVGGRIRLLEDRDGDGRCERSTVFATNLAFPNGVMAWRNGVLVTAAPDIWFLADTNNDGIADVRERILTGFAEGNQQLRVNGLFWGIDNWIYGANGRSDGEVKWADGTPAGSIRRHDFRFRPDTKEFEAIAGNSQFGMGHDDWGNRFPVFNNTPIRHVVMEEHYLAQQPSLAGVDLVPSISPTNDGNRVFALTPPTLLIPQPVGFFTSACGSSIFRGTALPESYRENYFVCEPVQNIVQRRVLKANGSSFVAEYAHTNKEFLASTDRWFHGVFTATGPDGALYIVDFYRDLVEHPRWVAPEIRDKVDWRKGEEHGRIWRVHAKNATLTKFPGLSRASNAELVSALKSDNGWTRDTAHRLLVERNAPDVIPLVKDLARKGVKAESRVHALNILSALNALDLARQLAGLDDSSARVREYAVRLAERSLPQWSSGSDSPRRVLKKFASMTGDSDARVRLQLACSLGAFTNVDSRLDVLVRLAQHHDLDEWQSIAILASAGPRPWLLLKRLTGMRPSQEQLGLFERAARMIGSGTNAEDKQALMSWLANWNRMERIAVAASFLEASSPKQSNAAPDYSRSLATIRVAAFESARDSDAPLHIRLAAIRLMEPEECVRLLNMNQPEALHLAAVRRIMESNRAQAIEGVFALWDQLSKTVRRQAIASGPRSRNAALQLLEVVSTEKVPLIEVDPVTRQTLEKFSDEQVKSRAAELFQHSISPDREAVVQKYRAALKLDADRNHGAIVFEKNCAVCHQMQGVGAKVGPDLSGIGQHARETLLVDILDPSRQVLPDFVAYSAETKSGDNYTGFIANETTTRVTLRRQNEPDITLQRSELKEFKTSGKSLMPDGLEAAMNEQDMADLIEFLRRPDRTLFSQAK